jgi:IMP dehydrogenase/GMP reductase
MIKLDWNDITIIPSELSSISSRSEVNPYILDKLPLLTAPMDKVVDEKNAGVFSNSRIGVCLPRHIKPEVYNPQYFYSFGLDEIIEFLDSQKELPSRVLIDVANGHMKKLHDTSDRIKQKFGDSVQLMVGNIANPETYKHYCKIGVDYIRVGIGGGSVCTTSANVSIHYPMASLISECAQWKGVYDKTTKIVADGGFRNFADIIKALGSGADYVMLGGIFNQCLESCGETFMKDTQGQYYPVDSVRASSAFDAGMPVYKYYRGMSTKEVQKSWNKEDLKTGEGIAKYNKVEYKLSGWVENFTDYLKSAMSYTDSHDLEKFIGGVKFAQISQNALTRFQK